METKLNFNMILEGVNYAISRDYSGLSDEVFTILRILKALKAIIIELTVPGE